MTKLEVIERLCKLRERVYREIDTYTKPCDCICRGGHGDAYFQDAGHVLTFIEDAVTKALAERDNGSGI